MKMLERHGIHLLLAALLLLATPTVAVAHDKDTDNSNPGQSKFDRLTTLTVYKTPTCGCCGKWVDHIEGAGFDVTTREFDDLTSIKRNFGISPSHQSCHTAVAEDGGYVFEGHIPAKHIKAFLAEPPAGARGLVVPAMPVGSPGMEFEDYFAPYDVLLLHADGSYTVFAHVSKPQDNAE